MLNPVFSKAYFADPDIYSFIPDDIFNMISNDNNADMVNRNKTKKEIKCFLGTESQLVNNSYSLYNIDDKTQLLVINIPGIPIENLQVFTTGTDILNVVVKPNLKGYLGNEYTVLKQSMYKPLSHELNLKFDLREYVVVENCTYENGALEITLKNVKQEPVVSNIEINSGGSMCNLQSSEPTILVET